MLDTTQQRIIGVLIEKELAVPDSYPLTENALLAGCNQKSNRAPDLSLEAFEISGALLALQESEWVVRSERDGGRAIRYRHKIEDKLSIDDPGKAVLAELLLRGPQAPGALKARVTRMGLHGTPEAIRDILDILRRRPSPLVQQLPQQPRERDCRWAHCLGDTGRSEIPEVPARRDVPEAETESSASPEAPTQEATVELAPPRTPKPRPKVLGERLADIEREVAELREEVNRLSARLISQDPDL